MFISISPRNQSTDQESLLQESSDPVAGTSGTRHPARQQLVQRKSQGRNKLIAWKCLGCEKRPHFGKIFVDTLPHLGGEFSEIIRGTRKIETKKQPNLLKTRVPHPSSSNSMGIPTAISILSRISVGKAMPHRVKPFSRFQHAVGL